MSGIPAPRLPQDSETRKRTPLCTGLLDYAPGALAAIAEHCTNFSEPEDLEAEIVSCLMDRGNDTCALSTYRGAFYALLLLEAELDGRDLEYRDWSTCFTIPDLFALFPLALAAVAQVSWHGNEKHNPGQPLHHARGKSTDHADCIMRHLVERGGFDGPFRHSAAMVWRWLMFGQQECEANGAPLARGARVPADAGLERVQRFWDAQSEWSQDTFGSDAVRGPTGALRHLALEAAEAEVAPEAVEEFADCLILLLDAARRAGHTLPTLMTAAEAKAEKNQTRIWPTPPAVDDGRPIEHVRLEDEEGFAASLDSEPVDPDLLEALTADVERGEA